MLITLLVFILILGIMVFVHELGHFLMAKRAGVKVLEFSFGFKPRLWSKKIGETTYGINAIPLGGYVHMYGEDEKQEGTRAYNNKTIFQRFLILIAGPIMNIVLGWLVLSILMITGFIPLFPGVAENPYINTLQTVKLISVADNSPASTSGLKAGDKILKIDDKTIATDSDFIAQIRTKNGQEVTLSGERDGSPISLKVTPRVNPPEGQGALGVTLGADGKVKSSVIAAPAAGLYETGRVLAMSTTGLVDYFKNLIVHQKISDDVTGLIGVGALTGVARRLGIDYLAQLLALISIGLGVANVLPILPLDGGHIAALAYEKVRGRPLSDRQFNALATAGLTFVVLLFIIISVKDFIRFDVLGRFF